MNIFPKITGFHEYLTYVGANDLNLFISCFINEAQGVNCEESDKNSAEEKESECLFFHVNRISFAWEDYVFIPFFSLFLWLQGLLGTCHSYSHAWAALPGSVCCERASRHGASGCVCLQAETSVLDCHRPLRLWQSFQHHQLNLHVHLRFQKSTDWICSNKENKEFNPNLPFENSALLYNEVSPWAQSSRTWSRSAGKCMFCFSP